MNRFQIYLTSSSYKSNIAKVLKQTYFTNYISIGKVKRVRKQEFE